ncbi:hypothetical protein KFK09_014130 [Dendrobium nobile]|uniref:Uncharacterized protein n=1 Tax=Dendrobium nobile TaxID=94219 RepID=A0A8T3BEV3_DENNO|nr:hypothetical protein KFK09_014130 [Dendrobium nobile]
MSGLNFGPERRALRWWFVEVPVVVRRGPAVVRRGSGGGPARPGGGPARFRWWSGEVPVVVRRSPVVVRRGSGGGPARLLRWSGGGRGGASSLAPSPLASCLDPSLVKNEGSIYRFSGVAWSVNRCEIRGK